MLSAILCLSAFAIVSSTASFAPPAGADTSLPTTYADGISVPCAKDTRECGAITLVVLASSGVPPA